jgi:hypothetical protein
MNGSPSHNPTYGAFPIELARRIGAASPLDGQDAPEPSIMLDWALRYAALRLHIFPADSFVGNPLIDDWYASATAGPSAIIKWWTKWPDADIGVAPDKSGHFVIGVMGDEGAGSLNDIEEAHGVLIPDHDFTNRWGNRYLWFPGSAISSRDQLGAGLIVYGRGRSIFMPPSLSRSPHEVIPD